MVSVAILKVIYNTILGLYLAYTTLYTYGIIIIVEVLFSKIEG